jgi:hypothetical protein
MGDAAMPQVNQVAGRLIRAQAIIGTNPGRSLRRQSLVVDQHNGEITRVQF